MGADGNVAHRGHAAHVDHRETHAVGGQANGGQAGHSNGHVTHSSGQAGRARHGHHLRHRDQVPSHLQFNRYVLSHYRPQLDWKGCLRSMTYLHNETVNVLTHDSLGDVLGLTLYSMDMANFREAAGLAPERYVKISPDPLFWRVLASHAIPILVILACIPVLLPWDSIRVPYLPAIHTFAFLAPWIGSTLYHLFMNHESGVGIYRTLLACDMVGIWIAQCFGSLIPIVSTIYCFDSTLQVAILSAYAFCTLFSCYKAVTAACPWQRRLSFVAPFAFRLVMVTLRAVGVGGGHQHALNYLVLQDIVAIVGAFLGAANIPERWFPGALDLFFNSHHIMHVLVVYAACLMHMAASMDLLWMSDEATCQQADSYQ